MRVVIISVTKAGATHVCVGAMRFDNGQPIRLLYGNGTFPTVDIGYRVGGIWDIDYVPRPSITEPHVEDVLIKEATNTNQEVENVYQFLMSHTIAIWSLRSELFDGMLHWTGSGSGFISRATGLPNGSVGFFRCRRDLVFEDGYYEVIRDNEFTDIVKFRYVGTTPSRPVITAGTLIRLSLARWWVPPDIEIEERCYCQLSGWYDE